MSHDAENSLSQKDAHNDNETLEIKLLVALYREECPDTMKLGEFHLGLLSKTEQAQIRAHLDDCPHCQAELSRLNEFLEEDIPVTIPPHTIGKPGWIKEPGFLWRQLYDVKQVIIRVLDEALTTTAQAMHPPANQLAYGGKRRSGKSGKTLLKLELKEGVEDLEVTVTAEEQQNDPRRCTVIVEVNIPSRGGWPNLGDTKVSLKEGTELQTRLTDAFGKAVFENVSTEALSNLDLKVIPRSE